jgi:hypothetical protein
MSLIKVSFESTAPLLWPHDVFIVLFSRDTRPPIQKKIQYFLIWLEDVPRSFQGRNFAACVSRERLVPRLREWQKRLRQIVRGTFWCHFQAAPTSRSRDIPEIIIIIVFFYILVTLTQVWANDGHPFQKLYAKDLNICWPSCGGRVDGWVGWGVEGQL